MEEVETEVENMECLEDPGLEDTENLTDEKEDDPDWHCQMEDKGDDDIDADDEETESTPMNNIRQDVMILLIIRYSSFLFRAQEAIACFIIPYPLVLHLTIIITA